MLERGAALMRMLRAERWPAAQLDRFVTRKLDRLLRHARERVPLYASLHGAGARDLRDLPVIDKAALRAAAEKAWDGAPRADDHWIETSGSTGEPFRFPIARGYDQHRKAQYLRPYVTNGRKLRDKVLRLTFAPRRPPWFARFGLLDERQIECTTPPAQVLEALRASRASILQGYPSALRLIAQAVLDGGTQPPEVKRIFTDSEMLGADTRRLVERAFGAPITDVFGTFETDNMAYQCERSGGYHVTTDCVIVEVLRDGKPVQRGEDGELVVTVLDNLRSPFIRYNLKDIVRWADRPCPCGRTFPLLEVIKGRSDDELRLPDGSRRTALAVVGVLYGFEADLLRYQLRQHPDGRCVLWYVPAPGARSDIAQALMSACAPLLAGAPLQVVRRDSIPLTRAHKLRTFVQVAEDDSAQ